MNMKILSSFIIVLLIVTVFTVDGKKTSRGRGGSSRGSSRKSGSSAQPVPTSFSNPQAAAPKPSLFGWQERPAQKTQTSSRQSSPTNSHSYPSSNTGLSGNSQPKQPSIQQESVQRNHAPQSSLPGTHSMQPNNHAGHSYPASNSLSGNSGTGSAYNNQPKAPPINQESIQRNVPVQSAGNPGAPSHSYPASNGLSGSSGTGSGYPQGPGLSGSNGAPPPYSPNANNMGNNYHHAQGHPPTNSNNGNYYNHAQGPPPPYSGVGSNYHHPPPPPAYSNYGPSYGGYGGQRNFNTGLSPQMPGYFGNYGGGKGFGGVGRTSSALTGVGIAGAGIGTVLTGLALWNLARSTGRTHHTVIYDNRGQPVAVAPDNSTANNSTAAAMDSILGDLINCSLTISNENVTEILAIPCAIATSFTPEVEIKDINENKSENDKTKCTITVLTKAEREFMTTIPCSVLLNTAAQNNVTEPPPILANSTELPNVAMASTENVLQPTEPSALRLSNGESDQSSQLYNNCTLKIGETPDPINPCFPITHNLTVIPLEATQATEI